MCYYGTRSARVGLDRDICQFIPRAFVFLVTIILYSRLFTFLRRPDTIQLSFHSTPKTSIIDVRSAQPARLPIAKLSKKLGITLSAACPQSPKKEVNPEAPWEAMEFIQVGNVDLLAPDATVTCVNDCAAARPPPASHFRALALESGSSSTNTLSAIAPPCKTEDASGTVQLSYDGSALISSSPKIGSSGVDVGVGVEASQTSMTIASAGCTTGFPALVESEKKVVGVKEEGEEPPEEQRQTLKEFFAEHQMSAAELGAVGKNGGGCQQRSATSYFNRQASLLMLYFPFAVSFFFGFLDFWIFFFFRVPLRIPGGVTRKVLMEGPDADICGGFPQYMAVFSVSLVRLVYDMAYSGSSNPVLGIISHWMVLSAGVIDGLVYVSLFLFNLIFYWTAKLKLMMYLGHCRVYG